MYVIFSKKSYFDDSVPLKKLMVQLAGFC